MNEDENEKSPNRSHDSSSCRDERASIVSSQPTKAKQIIALRVIREMRYRGVIQQLGRDVYTLVVFVADQLDEMRYRGMVPLFNGQLQSCLGFGDWRTLEKVRAKAIEAGWLKYEYRGNRKSGLYSVQIPSDSMDDCMLDCMESMQVYGDISTQATVNAPVIAPVNAPVITTAHVLPVPTPVPTPKEESSFQLASPSSKKSKKQKRPVIDPLTFEIPAAYRTAELQSAWADYCDMRRTSKLGAIDTLRKCNLFWDKAKGHTPATVLKAISIATGREWGEMFPEKLVAPQPPQPTAAPPQKRQPAENRPPRNRFGGISQ